MKRRVRWVLRLYPRSWRERYGAEFAALLEDVGPGWRAWLDAARGGLKMRIQDWSFGRVTTVCAITGAALAAGWALRVPSRYVGTAVIRWDDGSGNVQKVVLSDEALAAIIRREDLYGREREAMPMEKVVARMRRDVKVQPLPSARPGQYALYVQFGYPDRAKALNASKELAAAAADTQIGSRQMIELRVWDRGSHGPIGPLAGCVVGIAAGLLIAGARRLARGGTAAGA